MFLIKNTILKIAFLSIFSLFSTTVIGQLATLTEKANAHYITSTVIQASIDRRESNESKSSDDLSGLGGKSYIIDGPQTVDRVSKQGYTVVPRAPQGYWWYVSCGTVMDYYDDLIIILFNNYSCNTSTIKLFSNQDSLKASLTVTIIGGPDPLSAGQILTGSQSVKDDIVPGSLVASPAQGGSCSNAYQYQWQFSYNDTLYKELEDATNNDTLFFEGGIDQTVYFRRKVKCGTDSLYTASVAVFYIPPFNAGTITTTSQTIPVNTTPPVINASVATSSDCTTFSYQWEQSADGISFASISGATSQNLTYPTPLTGNIYYRRKATCLSESKFTNTILIRVKDTAVLAPPIHTTIDSVLYAENVDIAALFNIFSDSVANSRPVKNPVADSLEQTLNDNIRLFTLSGGQSALSAADIDSLSNAPANDDIEAKLLASMNGTAASDTTPVFIPMIDDNVIQLYRSTGNYAALDSIVNDIPVVSFAQASWQIEDSLNAGIPVEQRTYIPQINVEGMKQSAVISGAAIVERNQVVHYTGTLGFSTTSTNLQWLVRGGTIVSQNTNPSSGPLFADVRWESTAEVPYVALFDIGSSQYRIFPVFINLFPCRVYPATQTIYCGQTPSVLMASVCISTSAANVQYQWQTLDVYANTNWTDIPGATTANYQPGALDRPWLMYRRITKQYDGLGNLIATNVSSASSVQMWQLAGAQFQIASYNVEYNTVPNIIARPVSGGMLLQPGGVYSYSWEASINDGPWQQIGTSEQFPNYPIQYKKVSIRRIVTITGVPSSVYTLPEIYWKSTSFTFNFTYYYKTTDFENRNYIRENVVLTRGIDQWESADLLTSDKKSQTTTYLDGLSRPVQVVGKGTHYDESTNQWYDMVQSITYEAGGRVDKSLLAYPTTDNIGKFKTNVATAQPAYYLNNFGENNAFAKVEYDNSPQNRVKKSYAPGDSWVGSNVSVSGDAQVYNASVEKVRRWSVGYNAGDIPVSQGIYSSFNLIKVYGQDEKGKKVISYSDRSGNLILKKVQLDEGSILSEEHSGWLCTYYVYDDFGQLRFTITPKAVAEIEANNWVISSTVKDELCFWYDYDDLGRVIAKKTPGKNSESIVYDRKGRIVFTQDAGIAGSEPGNPILTTLYDNLNRPVITGLLFGRTMTEWSSFSASDPTSMTYVYINQVGSAALQGSPLNWNELTNPSVFRVLTINLYDEYWYEGAKTFNSNHADNLSYQNSNASGNIESNVITKRHWGMLTGTRTRVLNGNNASPTFLTSTVFYDEEGRALQVQSDNAKGGVEITSTQYHFDGRVLSTSKTHNGTGTAYTNFNILTKYKFDKIGRVTGVAQKINNAGRSYNSSTNLPGIKEDDDEEYKIIASYKYNELNRVVRKTLSPTYNNGQGIETLDYSYNMRGWLTGINKDYALGEYNSDQWQHFFGMYLGYDNKDGKFAAAQYNGSLTGVMWKSQGDNTPRKFDYEYDNAGRFTKANFNQRGSSAESWNKTSVDFSTKDVSYDLNGNLLTMKNMGIAPGGTTPIIVDNLSYQYISQSNKLRTVTDQATGSSNGKLGDFKDGTNTGTDDYSYDANGRLVLDNNKRISSIQYNYFDKPELITIAAPQGSTGGGTIRYIYSAGGSKIKKIVTESPAVSNGNQTKVITTTYIGAYVYEQVTVGSTSNAEELQMIMQPEGRIRIITPYINSSDPANIISGGVELPGGKQGVFDYYIKDNLGNIRATITEEINKAAGVCSMEDANATIKQNEEATFGNPGGNNEVNGTRIAVPAGWASNQSPYNSNQKVSKLQASGGVAKVGPNAFLKVMAGDKVRAKVDYYYQTDPGSSSNTGAGVTALVNSFASTLGGGRTAVVTHGNETAITGNLNSSTGLQDLFSNPPTGSNPNPNAPRAYLNYIFFDEQFNFVKEVSGFKRVSQPGDGADPIVTSEIKAVKNGYVYVYLSNESNEPVYFDNFSVSHERGRLLAEDHYYAYGLKIASISSKSISSSLNPNMPKFSYQGVFSEEVTEFELNYNEFQLRTYDPQIGRWTTADPYDEFASPYLGMGTDPANNVDPDGGSIWSGIMTFFGGGSAGAGCASTAGMSGYGYVASTAASAFSATTIIRTITVGIAVGGATFSHIAGQTMDAYKGGMQGFNGGSPGASGTGAEGGGGVSEPGDGIPQALNNNLQTNAGNDGGARAHGPNNNSGIFNDSNIEPPTEDDGWKDFSKDKLKYYVEKYGDKKFDTDGALEDYLGDVFEDTFHDFAKLNFTGEGYTPNSKKDHTDDGKGTVIDAKSDGFTGIRRQRFPEAAWWEIKAKKGGLWLSSNNYQILREISAMTVALKAAIAFGQASYNLVTTSDTNVGWSVFATTLKYRINYSHWVSQYKVIDGILMIRFVLKAPPYGANPSHAPVPLNFSYGGNFAKMF